MPLLDETPPGAFETDLAFALEGHAALAARLDALGDDPLRVFLDHVRATVPFYRDLGPALADLPLIDRDTIDRDPTRFLSTTHAGDIERLWGRTNGTLGTKLQVGFDLASFYELYSFCFARIVASRDGLRASLTPGEVGLSYVSDVFDDPRLTSYLPGLGGVLLRRMPIGRPPDEDAATIEELRTAAPPILYGKVPALLRVIELDRTLGGARIQPRTIVVSGAPLYPRDRRRLEAWFACPIVDAYIATEAGLIAIECERGTGKHVLDDRLHLEVLLPDGRLADTGTGELVITNVLNWAMPFVRYRLDDRVTLAPTCPCGWDGPTVVALHGRDLPGYDLDGHGHVDAATLTDALDLDGVRQFEVSRPDAGRLLVRWIPTHDAPPELAAELAHRLHAAIGASFELRQVEKITIRGGKGLRFVRQPRFPDP